MTRQTSRAMLALSRRPSIASSAAAWRRSRHSAFSRRATSRSRSKPYRDRRCRRPAVAAPPASRRWRWFALGAIVAGAIAIGFMAARQLTTATIGCRDVSADDVRSTAGHQRALHAGRSDDCLQRGASGVHHQICSSSTRPRKRRRRLACRTRNCCRCRPRASSRSSWARACSHSASTPARSRA